MACWLCSYLLSWADWGINMKTRKQLHGVIDSCDSECVFQVLKAFSLPGENHKLVLHLYHTQAKTCSTPVVFCFAHSNNSGAFGLSVWNSNASSELADVSGNACWCFSLWIQLSVSIPKLLNFFTKSWGTHSLSLFLPRKVRWIYWRNWKACLWLWIYCRWVAQLW